MKQLSKKTALILVVMTFIVTATFSGCDSPAEKVDTAKDNVTEAKEDLKLAEDDYKTEVANFKEESNKKITANQKIIADFKTQMATTKKDIKVSYEKQVAALEEKNANMKKRMDGYKDDGKEKWQSFKREFNHDMDELGKSLKDFTVDNDK